MPATYQFRIVSPPIAGLDTGPLPNSGMIKLLHLFVSRYVLMVFNRGRRGFWLVAFFCFFFARPSDLRTARNPTVNALARSHLAPRIFITTPSLKI